MDMEDLLAAFCVIGLIGLILAALFLGGKFVDVKFIQNVPVKVQVDGKEVYSGPSAGVNVDSSGANTTVSISGGLLYMFPKEYYVSKNVKLIGKK